MINSAIWTCCLFFALGCVNFITNHTDFDSLGGLVKWMPVTFTASLVAVLAISGVPPLNGFASKLLIYESTFQLNPILSIVAILSSIMLLAVFIKVFHSAFLGPALPKFNEVKVILSTLLDVGKIAA